MSIGLGAYVGEGALVRALWLVSSLNCGVPFCCLAAQSFASNEGGPPRGDQKSRRRLAIMMLQGENGLSLRIL
jgi:hypothetical protein